MELQCARDLTAAGIARLVIGDRGAHAGQVWHDQLRRQDTKVELASTQRLVRFSGKSMGGEGSESAWMESVPRRDMKDKRG